MVKKKQPRRPVDGLGLGHQEHNPSTDSPEDTALQVPVVDVNPFGLDDEEDLPAVPIKSVPPPKVVPAKVVAGKAKEKVKRGRKSKQSYTDSSIQLAGGALVDLRDMDAQRELTKKHRETLKIWTGSKRQVTMDHFWAGMLEATRLEKGHENVVIAGRAQNTLVGIPMPSLAMEYLITQNVFPLGLILHLVGKPGSLKSALLYEFFRWFLLHDGGAILAEAESKFSPDLMESLVTPAMINRVIKERCENTEDWQEKTMYWIKLLQKQFMGTKEAPGPGRSIPVIFGVDSIMGKLSAESQENVEKAGSGARAYPIEALLITQFMKTVPRKLVDWPFALVLNNHRKGVDTDRKRAGGEGVHFQESWELETSINKGKMESSEERWRGVRIWIRCYKNSFGDTGRSIKAQMRWWQEEDPDTGLWAQVSRWDWGWATVELLRDLQGVDKANFKEMGLHLDTPAVSDVGHKAWSKNFGMKSSDAVSWHEMGDMIHNDAEYMRKARIALGIKLSPILAGNYAKQVGKILDKLE